MTLDLMANPPFKPSSAVSSELISLMRYHAERALELADLLDLSMTGIHLHQALVLITAIEQERGNRLPE